jgi:hypothetical protein
VVGSALMTFGPAMSGGILDGPRAQQRRGDETSEQILATLKEILARLQAAAPVPPSNPADTNGHDVVERG